FFLFSTSLFALEIHPAGNEKLSFAGIVGTLNHSKKFEWLIQTTNPATSCTSRWKPSRTEGDGWWESHGWATIKLFLMVDWRPLMENKEIAATSKTGAFYLRNSCVTVGANGSAFALSKRVFSSAHLSLPNFFLPAGRKYPSSQTLKQRAFT